MWSNSPRYRCADSRARIVASWESLSPCVYQSTIFRPCRTAWRDGTAALLKKTTDADRWFRNTPRRHKPKVEQGLARTDGCNRGRLAVSAADHGHANAGASGTATFQDAGHVLGTAPLVGAADHPPPSFRRFDSARICQGASAAGCGGGGAPSHRGPTMWPHADAD